jgi:N-acetylmuramoyl-L-alanine amidase
MVFNSSAYSAGTAQDLLGVRLWAAPGNTRLVFDTSGPVKHNVFGLKKPERLVIDLSDARMAAAVKKKLPSGGAIKQIRTAPRKGGDLRVVLDLGQAVKANSFQLKPNKQYGHRLVVDLDYVGKARSDRPANAPVKQVAQDANRELVIVIDAGHGGEDPGAKGRHGTREKDVVLQIARRLADFIEKEPGMRPVLTRKGDYFLGLRKRIDVARKYDADMFVSVHADAFRDRSVQGSSVYILSRRGASSEMARWLADSENASDLVGGVSLGDKEELLVEVLLDLSQSATMESSAEAAGYVLKEMKRVGKVHKNNVQQAGFVVLKSPDIPSMLVETAFISNPIEEKRLKSPQHQQRIAASIMRGIKAYFAVHPPVGTLMAANQTPREHVIKRGDTLSELAHRYGVSMRSIRSANRLKNDRLLVGKRLTIPSGES